jgi:catechol 2,3-dioxygenase-like lactoylglutathione lyase family enzyme
MASRGQFRFGYFTPEYDATVEFYRDLLHLRVVECWNHGDDDRGTLFSAASGMIEVLSRPKAHSAAVGGDKGPLAAFIVIEVADVEQAYRTAVARRLPIQRELTTQPWGRRAFSIREPNGLTLSVFSEPWPQ